MTRGADGGSARLELTAFPDLTEVLPKAARRHLSRELGWTPRRTPPVPVSEIRLAPSRLTHDCRRRLTDLLSEEHVSTDREARLRRAGGKSYLDLLRRREGASRMSATGTGSVRRGVQPSSRARCRRAALGSTSVTSGDAAGSGEPGPPSARRVAVASRGPVAGPQPWIVSSGCSGTATVCRCPAPDPPPSPRPGGPPTSTRWPVRPSTSWWSVAG